MLELRDPQLQLVPLPRRQANFGCDSIASSRLAQTSTGTVRTQNESVFLI